MNELLIFKLPLMRILNIRNVNYGIKFDSFLTFCLKILLCDLLRYLRCETSKSICPTVELLYLKVPLGSIDIRFM